MKTKLLPLAVTLSGLLGAGCAGTAEDVCTMAAQHVESCMGASFPELGANCNPEEAQRVLDIDCKQFEDAGMRDTYLFGGLGGLGGLLGLLGGGGVGFGDDGHFGFGDILKILGVVIDAADGDSDIFGGGSSSNWQCQYGEMDSSCYRICVKKREKGTSGCSKSGYQCQAVSQKNACLCRDAASDSKCGGSGDLFDDDDDNDNYNWKCGHKAMNGKCYRLCLKPPSFSCSKSGYECQNNVNMNGTQVCACRDPASSSNCGGSSSGSNIGPCDYENGQCYCMVNGSKKAVPAKYEEKYCGGNGSFFQDW
jgi:hypothetical protein